MRRVSRVLPPDVTRHVLSALVLSQLDYCCIIWHGNASIKKILKITSGSE